MTHNRLRGCLHNFTNPKHTVGAATAGTSLEGEVVRVVGENQIVVRTPAGKEVIMYVTPKTTYTYDDRPWGYSEVRPGTPIRVDYDNRDGRFYGRSIFGLRRGKK